MERPSRGRWPARRPQISEEQCSICVPVCRDLRETGQTSEPYVLVRPAARHPLPVDESGRSTQRICIIDRLFVFG